MKKLPKKMIRVAYVATAPFISGSERCLQHILQNLDLDEIKPLLITAPKSPMVQWAKQNDIRVATVDILAVTKSNKANLICSQLKLLTILLANKIDIVHSNQIWSFKILDRITRLLNIKRVCHFRDPITNGSKWWLPNSIDVAVFISKHIENEFFNIFSRAHVNSYLTNLDPIKSTQPLSRSELINYKNRSRLKFNIDVDCFTFGFIGQIAPIKGLLELLSTLSDLQSKNWQLIIAGADPSDGQEYLQSCKDLVERENLTKHVHFLGFIDNVKDFYYATDVVVMLSHEEPLGLIPLEAGMHYTPTIASEVGGLPETIDHNKTGWLVQLEDQEMIKSAFTNAMASDLMNMGENARTLVTTKCDSQKYTDNLKRLYQK